jgi:hypothetical protein
MTMPIARCSWCNQILTRGAVQSASCPGCGTSLRKEPDPEAGPLRLTDWLILGTVLAVTVVTIALAIRGGIPDAPPVEEPPPPAASGKDRLPFQRPLEDNLLDDD